MSSLRILTSTLFAITLLHGAVATAGGGDVGTFPRGTYSKTQYGAIKWGMTREAWTITFSGQTTITADLLSLTGDLDLELIKGTTVVARSAKGGTQSERIGPITLEPGTYKFQVYPYGAAQSGYSLRLGFTVASSVTELEFSGGTNPKGFFTRTIGTSSTGSTHWVVFNITSRYKVPIRLSGMTINLDVDLRKGSKTGTVVASSTKGGTTTEDIVTTLDPGVYYLRIYRNGGTGSTSYRNEIQTGGTIRW